MRDKKHDTPLIPWCLSHLHKWFSGNQVTVQKKCHYVTQEINLNKIFMCIISAYSLPANIAIKMATESRTNPIPQQIHLLQDCDRLLSLVTYSFSPLQTQQDSVFRTAQGGTADRAHLHWTVDQTLMSICQVIRLEHERLMEQHPWYCIQIPPDGQPHPSVLYIQKKNTSVTCKSMKMAIHFVGKINTSFI